MNPSSLVTQQFTTVPAEEGAPRASLSTSTSVPSSSQPCSRFCAKAHILAKHGSRAPDKQSPTLHISPMKVATFYDPKAESFFLKPSYSVQKHTRTHCLLKPLKKIPVRENNHCSSITNKNATNHNRSDDSKISPWTSFYFSPKSFYNDTLASRSFK